MSLPLPQIGFRTLTADDLPLLGQWMQEPHWREWWGDPETELGYVRDMIEGRDSTEPYIIELDGAPSGYIQVWYPAQNRFEPWLTEAPWLMWMPDDAVGVDLSLSAQSLLGRGIGTAALRAFCDMLRGRGHKNIYIDPDPDNARAMRAYEKAGFRPVPKWLGKTGDSLIMQLVD